MSGWPLTTQAKQTVSKQLTDQESQDPTPRSERRANFSTWRNPALPSTSASLETDHSSGCSSLWTRAVAGSAEDRVRPRLPRTKRVADIRADPGLRPETALSRDERLTACEFRRRLPSPDQAEAPENTGVRAEKLQRTCCLESRIDGVEGEAELVFTVRGSTLISADHTEAPTSPNCAAQVGGSSLND